MSRSPEQSLDYTSRVLAQLMWAQTLAHTVFTMRRDAGRQQQLLLRKVPSQKERQHPGSAREEVK